MCSALPPPETFRKILFQSRICSEASVLYSSGQPKVREWGSAWECLDLRYLKDCFVRLGDGGRQGPVLKNSPPNVKPSKTGNEQERQTGFIF